MGKTIEEFYKEIKASDRLARKAVSIRTNEEYEQFLKENNCDATPTEAIIYFSKHSSLGKGRIVFLDGDKVNAHTRPKQK